MSSQDDGCEEEDSIELNLVNGRQANSSAKTTNSKSIKQNLLNSEPVEDDECLNLINSDNSGSECSSPRERNRSGKSNVDESESSSFNSESCTTSMEKELQSNENTELKESLSSTGSEMENIEGARPVSTEQSVPRNDKGIVKTGNSEPSIEINTLQTTQHVIATSNNCHGSDTISNGDFCGSPPSDITEPELAQVSATTKDNWCSRGDKARKDGLFSESPSSDFECSASSSCAEDSGISSTVRDDEMEEIPLADGTLSPELFQEMSRLNVNDMVSSWVPKSNNTYAPNISSRSGSASSMVLLDTHRSQHKTKPGSEYNQSTVGWKLFGKVPPKEAVMSETFHRGDVLRGSFDGLSSTKKHKSLSFKKSSPSVANSTTALIFENRPRNLPAKSPIEEKKHRQQYETMVAQARKKELQEVKKQEKQMKDKKKQEKLIVNAATMWTNEILNNWETMKASRKAKELWWQGIPPSVRGKVWKLAIGNDLQITYELFDIFQAHAFEKLIVTRNNKKRLNASKSVAELPTNNFIPVVSSEHKVELIMMDVSRTFPSLCIFQEGGPFHDLLHSILGAYTCYRPDVGYVQGMSFIAAVLLLNMEPPDAFVCFANLLNKPCQLVFFRVDHPMMKAYFATFEILLDEFLPKISSLFVEENFSPDMYLIDWIFTLFSKSLPLDVACRVWDVFCRDGDDFLFRTALGILKYYQTELMGMDFIHLGQFLSKLPDGIPANKLFDCIASINLSRQKFNQILAQQKELATQIKSVTASAGK